MSQIHRSKMGTYHPAQSSKGTYYAWTIHDSRGTIDGGPACDECGACECAWCECEDHKGKEIPACQTHFNEGHECIGLSFAFVCLDGGETLCEECAEKAGITIIDCDCA